MRDKASALILFDSLATACDAVTLLSTAPVAAVELADRAALRSVEGKPGLPESLGAVGPDGAALLVETRAADAAALAAQIREIEATLAGVATFEPVRFSTDPAECARYWNVRKGMFPSVGAMRKTGTTVIIEDVAFPVDAARGGDARPAAAPRRTTAIPTRSSSATRSPATCTSSSRRTSIRPPRSSATAASWTRSAGMVVEKYDGSLKAEHGTGRNVAPFVELEWGADAYALMRADQGAVRSAEPSQSRCADQRRPARAHRQPEAAARGRSARGQVHRVRLLRAQVPVARPDALAATADRRLARDRAARARGRGLAPARALRLRGDRHLRGLRAVRDRVPGRHRDGAAHQGVARAARVAAGPSRRGHGGRPFRRRDRRRARGTRPRQAALSALRGPVDGLRRATGAPLPKWSPALPRPASWTARCGRGRVGRPRRLLPELRRAHDGRPARRRRRGAARRRPRACSARRGSTS